MLLNSRISPVFAVLISGLLLCCIFSSEALSQSPRRPATALAPEPAAQLPLYEVGVARVDITPDYPVRLNGFAVRKAESEGVSSRLYARALTISMGDQPPLIVVAIDSLGIRLPMVDALAAKVGQQLQVPRENVVVTFTHTHSAPKVNGASDNIFAQAIPSDHQSHIDLYSAELAESLARAVTQALKNRRKARLEWGIGKVEFSKNRRLKDGPVDHSLPVLLARDADTGNVIATYVSYACHAVTLSFNQLSADWPGYAAETLEREFPDSVALVSIGAGSDSNPISGVTGDKVDVARSQGAEIGDEVVRLVKRGMQRLTGLPQAKFATIDLPLKPLPTRAEWETLAAKGGAAGYNATTQLARLDRGEKLTEKIDYAIQSWTFGDDLAIVFLAGEVCVDYSIRLKSELRRNSLWVNAYSNDFCSYIPSERLLREGGYGGGAEIPYFALPTTFATGLEEKIVAEVHRQIAPGFQPKTAPPQTPKASLNSFKTHGDLRIELVAAEPLISDPVAIDFGDDGRLWVAEMNDYGRGVYESFKGSGRIRVLTDRDRDGQFDVAVTFLDGLRFPTDVKRWRDGVLICDAPDILFARDRDNDGVADDVKTLYSGFEVRNAQARVNSLRWGLDNVLYGACGLFGGNIHVHSSGAVVAANNRDFRFQPDTDLFEPATGRSQQGRCRNDWGDWFGCSNGNLIKYFPTDDRIYRRNPLVTPPPSELSVATGPGASELMTTEELVRFELSGPPGRPTSACGIGIYRDRVLGADYYGNAFTCEPVHQAVHRLVLNEEANGYVGRRPAGEEQREFLTSSDKWFRPVQARTGPDGGLWIVDMYRYVIEHSRWIPQTTLEGVDVFAGQGRGRIYRILPKEKAVGADVPNWAEISSLSATDLAERMANSNGVVRDMCHQRLIWLAPQQEEVAAALQSHVTQNPNAAVRLQALSALDGLSFLDSGTLITAMRDVDSHIVRAAVKLSAAQPNDENVFTEVLKLAGHPDRRVQIAVAYSLGEWRAEVDKSAAAKLVQIALGSEGDRTIQATVESSLHARLVPHLMASVMQLTAAERRQASLRSLLLLGVRMGETADVVPVLEASLKDTRPLPIRLREVSTLLTACRSDSALTETERVRIQEPLMTLWQSAEDSLADKARGDAEHLAAITFMSNSGPLIRAIIGDERRAGAAVKFGGKLNQTFSVGIQEAAALALARLNSPDAIDRLLTASSHVGPQVRATIFDSLLSRETSASELLQALEDGRVSANLLDATLRGRLENHASAEVQKTAKRVLGVNLGQMSKRVPSELIGRYETALAAPRDLTHGKAIFAKSCASCHRLDNVGFTIGPDLAALSNRDERALLVAALDPNREVDARYITWVAALNDGRTLSGILVEETATTVRLREAGGKEHVVLRNDLESLRSSQKSLMPEGIEKDLSPKDLANVLAYVSQFKRQIAPGSTEPATKPAPAVAMRDSDLPRYPPQIAPFLLDETQPLDLKIKVIDLRPGMGPAIVQLLTQDLKESDYGSEEEYRRIPWIWRVAIATGKRNDGGELRDLLEVSLPAESAPLRDWQAVVVGGGIINGLTQVGVWPRQRIEEIFAGAPSIGEPWSSTLRKSVEMADNSKVRPGTRYDALRMVAMLNWDESGKILTKYLKDGPRELQMGAVSGLGDIQHDDVVMTLVAALPMLTRRNRTLAIEALQRTPRRQQAYRDAEESEPGN
jgi:putative membrane-bound dehydrogenase-like protein